MSSARDAASLYGIANMTDMRSQLGRERRPAVLVIAATDSSGGAGLTRDVRVLTDFSADALCVVTAVTAQSDKRVTAVHHIPPEVIRAQLSAALKTRGVGAIKLGMLGIRVTVEAVAQSLADALAATTSRVGSAVTPANPGGPVAEAMPAHRTSIPLVVDPVLVSSSGGILLDAAGRVALLEKVLPLATLVTPNVPEVAALLGEPVAVDEAELIQQGRQLLEFGCRAILLKGGHAAGEEAVDLLIARSAFGKGGRSESDDAVVVERITSKRVAGSSRGTGCALASGIAAGLASGLSLSDACRRAKHYVLEKMLTPGPNKS